MPSAADFLSLAEFFFQKWGLWVLFIGAFLENSVILGFLFPGVTIILFSGFAARTTGTDLGLIVFLATAGSFLGDNLDYLIGKKLGRILETKPLFAKPVSVVEPFLAKHGIYAVFVGRFSGWSRAWVALSCGITAFPYFKFAAVSFLSAFVWVSAWIVGGYLLGGNHELIEDLLSKASIFAWIGFVLILAYYFKTRIKLFLELAVFMSKKYGRRVKEKISK